MGDPGAVGSAKARATGNRWVGSLVPQLGCPCWKLGSMVMGSVGVITYLYMGYMDKIGVTTPTDPITFDANFQQDIQADLFFVQFGKYMPSRYAVLQVSQSA